MTKDLKSVEKALENARAKKEEVKKHDNKLRNLLSKLYDEVKAQHESTGERATEEQKKKINEVIEKMNESASALNEADFALEILNNNKLSLLVANCIEPIKEEFAKYDGKPYGEKTKRKIADSIKERCGVSCWIDTDYAWSTYTTLNIFFKEHGFKSMQLYISNTNEDGERMSALTDNKINATAFNYIVEPKIAHSFVENVDKYIKEWKKKRASILKEQEKLLNAINDFNDFNVLENKRVSHTKIY